MVNYEYNSLCAEKENSIYNGKKALSINNVHDARLRKNLQHCIDILV